MTQFEAVKAYMSLRTLNAQRTSGRVAKKIFDLMNKLKPLWEFQTQEEQKLFEKYPFLDPQTMRLNLGDSEMDADEKLQLTKEIKQAFDELSGAELDEKEFEPYKFEIDLENEDLKLSGEDIANLSPFVTFN